MTELKGIGNLPTTCPNCNTESVDWEWTDNVVYDEQIVNEAKCPKCNIIFEEIMEVTSWVKKEIQE